jgi:hypothetical protein
MLEPQGFHDAICAYNLPESIVQLDQSSQANVPYHIKTAFGFTDSFMVNGVTKQGGSLSPLKCTLTTSLCNRWLSDRSYQFSGSISIFRLLMVGRPPGIKVLSMSLTPLLPLPSMPVCPPSIIQTHRLL